MSINFDNPINDEAKKMMDTLIKEKILPAPVVQDEFRALFNDSLVLPRRKMTELANTAKQPVKVELNEVGEIKTMSDGTKYQVTPQGWRKIK